MSVENLIKTSAKSGEGRIFGAYLCDDETTQQLVPVLSEREWDTSQVKTGGIESAIRTLATIGSPQFLLVDLSNSIDPEEDINALAEVCEPGTMVITVGKINDINFYRNMIACGVQDYLVKPVSTDQLRDAFLAAEHTLRTPIESTPAEEHKNKDKVISFIGVRGGVGASTLATNCAWILANERKQKTALVDLDMHFGTGALSFDLEPGRGLTDALENPSRVDGLFIERAMIKESENLSILGSEAPLNDPSYTDPAALNHLLIEMRNNFKYVILDLPRSIVADYPLLISETDEVILVTDLTLSATRDVVRFLAFCKTVAPQVKVRVLVNKMSGPGLVEVSKNDFETTIERKIDWEIPLDSKLMIQVAKSGKILAHSAKHSKIAKQIQAICDSFTGGQSEEKSAGLLEKIGLTKKK
ncbi:MAG: AAA family ATPase [Alphaproteobacteria bacterium]|nr:AAA family ATPase [Alphaproteobacteria bacterium]HPF46288.1 AAA family ATPase [Emcibacteraceae bacterium]